MALEQRQHVHRASAVSSAILARALPVLQMTVVSTILVAGPLWDKRRSPADSQIPVSTQRTTAPANTCQVYPNIYPTQALYSNTKNSTLGLTCTPRYSPTTSVPGLQEAMRTHHPKYTRRIANSWLTSPDSTSTCRFNPSTGVLINEGSPYYYSGSFDLSSVAIPKLCPARLTSTTTQVAILPLIRRRC